MRLLLSVAAGTLLLAGCQKPNAAPASAATGHWEAPPSKWPPNSDEKPKPPTIDPGPAQAPAPIPSDAVVLFNGKDLSAWAGDSGQAAPWTVRDGYMEVVPGSGAIHTRQAFGDMQLHIEYATPTPPHGEGQERGNSGVFLMTHYEIQVLDDYQNTTNADGMAAAVYGQTPPLVNASRPSGEWQSYDIVFHRPHFAADSSVEQPATVTVFHNGVLVQDNTVITGWTVDHAVAHYRWHPDSLPLMLQDHGNTMRFRNIWVRPL
jgi:hypothetical protein